MNFLLFLLEKALLALVPILLFAFITMLFIPALMFNYVLPTERTVISAYNEAEKTTNENTQQPSKEH